MTRIIRILSLCLLLIGVGAARGFAQTDPDEYNPTNPAEPQVIDFCKIIVEADPAEGAYVSGGGKYRMGGSTSRVQITTSARNTDDWTYTFKYWTLNGEKVSENRSFYYTLQKGEQHFVAHYEKTEVIYDPTNPAEPSGATVKRKYYLYLEPTLDGACSFNIASGEKQIEGTSLYLRIYPNAYYRFEGWRINGEIVSTSTSFYYTMPSHETHIEAVLTEIPYDPANPGEPPSGGGEGVDTGGDDGGDDEAPEVVRQLITLNFGAVGGATDKTRIVFNTEKSLDYESDCDAAKFLSESAAYQVYTMNGDNVTYQINERPIADGRVLIGYKTATAGTVQISAARLDNEEAILRDKLLGTEHALAAGPYVFETEAGTFDDRFELLVPGIVCIGDANGDGRVTIVDVVLFIDRLGKTSTLNDVNAVVDTVLER